MEQHWYDALGLDASATDAEIRAAYATILRQVAERAPLRDPADLERLENARTAFRALMPAAA